MFEVMEKRSNWDSEKSRVVAEFDTQEEASADAQRRKGNQMYPWAAFVVRKMEHN